MHCNFRSGSSFGCVALWTLYAGTILAQAPPYDVYPAAKPPYYRVRYEASTEPGGLIFPVKYTVWIPPGVQTLKGVVVHQHGCGEEKGRNASIHFASDFVQKAKLSNFLTALFTCFGRFWYLYTFVNNCRAKGRICLDFRLKTLNFRQNI